ncbi:MAG TPA: DinB family protein [Gemmatimonadales bacterium]|nr:DinB family protein [Gemmatimonadales bacterium]
MQPQLESVVAELRAALARLDRLAAGVTPEAWTRAPAPGRWSAAECVAHLNLTAAAYLPILDAGLEEARRHGSDYRGRYRRDLLGWMLWRSVAEGGHVKSRTMPDFVPASAEPSPEVVQEFRELHEALIARVVASDGLRIDRVRMPSAFNPRIRYSIWSAFTILARHAHRHLRQAEVAAGRAG